jgi:hypothetical protein
VSFTRDNFLKTAGGAAAAIPLSSSASQAVAAPHRSPEGEGVDLLRRPDAVSAREVQVRAASVSRAGDEM